MFNVFSIMYVILMCHININHIWEHTKRLCSMEERNNPTDLQWYESDIFIWILSRIHFFRLPQNEWVSLQTEVFSRTSTGADKSLMFSLLKIGKRGQTKLTNWKGNRIYKKLTSVWIVFSNSLIKYEDSIWHVLS